MGSGIVVHRTEAEEIKSIGGWILIFGRRKVGKTFLIRNFLDYDVYFYVRADGSIREERGEHESILNGFEDMVERAKAGLKRGETVVIDEFQRLNPSVWEEIASVHPNGRLILSGSSMKVVSKVISRNSPLLGIVYPYELGLIRPVDVLRSLFGNFRPDRAVELAPYLRDPWTIPLLSGSEDFFVNLTRIMRYAVPGLVGEIFTEEEREMSRTYRSIISLVGEGYERYEEMASILCTRGIIKRPESALVLPYMKNLQKMGILRANKIYGKKKYRYYMASEPMWLYFYLNSRYDFSREISYGEMKPTVERMKSMAVERFAADLFAEIRDGRVEILKNAEKEVDILITSRERPILVGEVKWGKAMKRDISDFLKKTEDFYCEKVFFTKNRIEDPRVKVMGPEDLKELVGYDS